MILLFGICLLPPVRSVIQAVSLVGRFVHRGPLALRIWWRLTDRKTTLTETTIPGTNGPIQVRMFTPVGVKHPPVIVLVHGFSKEGMREGGVGAIGHELAMDGYQVIVPNLPILQNMLIQPGALYQIGDTVHWAHGMSGRRVALIGVSFGGGLSLRVASMPQYASDLGTVFVMGGFNSIQRLCEFFTGQGATEPDGSVDRHEPSGLGFPVMAIQHPDEEVPPADQESIGALTKRLVEVKSLTPQFLAELATYPERIQHEFMELITVTPEQDARYRVIFARHGQEYAELSPHGHLANVRAEIFLLHGQDDILIPPAEARWNVKELRDSGRTVHLSLTPWVNHRDLVGQTALRDKIRFILFIGDSLRAVRSNS